MEILSSDNNNNSSSGNNCNGDNDDTKAVGPSPLPSPPSPSSLSSSSQLTEGGEKEKTDNDVRCSVTTRDCGTSFDRKHVSGSGKTFCRKSSGSKNEKITQQPSLAGSPTKLAQHLQPQLLLAEQVPGVAQHFQQLTELSQQTIIEDTDDDDDDDEISQKRKGHRAVDNHDTNNNISTTTSSSAVSRDDHEDHHGNKDHQNSRHPSTHHHHHSPSQTQQAYFNPLRVSAFNDVSGHMGEPFYSMFPCNYPPAACYPPVLGTYPPFYPTPYLFPMNLAPTQPPLLPSTAFPYSWPVVNSEVAPPQYPMGTGSKGAEDVSSPKTSVGDSSVGEVVSSLSETSATTAPTAPAGTSSSTSLFNFPWMKSQDTLSPPNHLIHNPQLFPSAFEATKRKFSAVDVDDKESATSPLTCKRFHGDTNPPPYVSGLGGCWPMTHFYYAPHFDFRSLMVNPFSPNEVTPCDSSRTLLGGGGSSGGYGKADPYANLFSSLYSVPYLHGISTR